MSDSGFASSSIRPGHPEFLDLPWGLPLSDWTGQSERLVDMPRGPSRHPVVFAAYDRRVYAVKELAPGQAAQEYRHLRGMAEHGIPVVEAVGHVETRTSAGEASVLITRFLDRSLPYHLLFQRGSLERYREHLLDALGGLLVQLHLAGVFWGDCSLYNTLFRRDAGELQAYLVDAETSELRPTISDGLRERDVEIMEENVAGGLADLQALGTLSDGFDVFEMGAYVRRRYNELWDEITREVVIRAGENYRIQERVRALNALGFSVDEVELRRTDEGERIHLRAVVTDRKFHHHLLQHLTGLDVEEMQARQMVNEIQSRKATLTQMKNSSVPLSVAAFAWMHDLYLPIVERMRSELGDDVELEPAQLYCELLEHKWFLSERAQRDVGHDAALEDYVAQRRCPPTPGE